MSIVQNGRVMKNRWVNRDTAEFSARGIVFFHSQFEFPEPLPCKMYKIDQTHGSLWDHTHDYFQIWYVVRGCFTHSYLGRQYEMQAGSKCIVPPYAVHRVEWMLQEKTEIIGCEFLPVYINDSFNQPMLQEDCLDYRYLQPLLAEEGKRLMKVSLIGEDDLQVRHILEEMRKEFRMKTPHYGLVMKANLLKLLVIIGRIRKAERENGDAAPVVPNKKAERLNRCRDSVLASIDFVQKHYREEIRLDQICRHASLSKTNFCDVFKAYTGKTFNEYLNDLRLRHATEQLLKPDVTVAEACRAVGFRDLTHFSRMFKKCMGVSPSHFRKISRRL
ncbi:AraC family transcriptional regulator [Paenibacillus apiarius]|uniref:AraC family transcriptional regulator n=1 Tax=Paenibacillus apiarius TaxID=46240 RepID=UPI003B3AA3AB